MNGPGAGETLRRGLTAIVAVGFGKVLVFLMMVVLARTLGPAAFSVFAATYSMLFFTTWLAAGGMQVAVVRSVADAEAKGSSFSAFAGERVVLAVAAAVATGAVLWTIVGGVAFIDSWAQVVLMVAIVVTALGRYWFGVAQGLHEVMLAVRAMHVMRPVVLVSVTLLAAIVAGPAETAILGFAVAGATLFLRLRTACGNGRSAELNAIGDLVRRGLWVLAAGAAFQSLSSVDKMVVVWLVGASEASGVYASAAMLCSYLGVLGAGIVAGLVPTFVRGAAHKDKQQMSQAAAAATKLSTMVFFPVLLLAAGAPKLTLTLVYGQAYRSGSEYFSLLGGAWALYYAKGPIAQFLVMARRERLVVANSVIVLVAFLLMLVLFARTAFSVAVSIAVAVLLLAALEVFQARRSLRLRAWHWFGWRCGVLTGAFLAGAITARAMGWSSGTVALAALFPIAFMLVCVNAEERASVWELGRRFSGLFCRSRG